jgi:hypothetical protein
MRDAKIYAARAERGTKMLEEGCDGEEGADMGDDPSTALQDGMLAWLLGQAPQADANIGGVLSDLKELMRKPEDRCGTIPAGQEPKK